MEERITSDKNKCYVVKLGRAQNSEARPWERGILMPSDDSAIKLYDQAKDKDDFISFLRFCSERLGKGETVREVWLGYLEIAAQKSK